MGSIGIISLTNSAKSKISSFCRTYPVVKVRPRRSETSRTPPESDATPSDPLVDGLRREDTDQGIDRGRVDPDRSSCGIRGVGPRCSYCDGAVAGVVETRRLELLTLSLQRRRSTN